MKKLFKKNLLKYLIFSLTILVISFAFYTKPKSASTPSIYYTVNSTNINLGDNFDIDVRVTNISDLYGASIDIYYDKTLIDIEDILTGNVFNTTNISSAKPIVDKINGKISFYSTLYKTSTGVATSDNILFKIKAKSISGGYISFRTLSGGTTGLLLNDIRIKLANSASTSIPFTQTALNFNINNTVGTAAYRFAGDNRYDTAVEVSKTGWPSSTNVVLAFGYNFPDALAGAPLAYIKDAPILLVTTSSIPDSTMNEIKRLGAKNIYILGSPGLISQTVENTLKSSNYTVTRLYGANRFETAIAIGNEVMKNNNTKTAVLATASNYPDALAISPYASMNKYPILFTNLNTLDAKTKNFLTTYGINNVIIPGSPGVVSNNVVAELTSIGIISTRVSGPNRYDTALAIVSKYEASFTNDLCIATGTNFPDALAGGVLAAKKQVPLLLVGKDAVQANVLTYIKNKGDINIFVLGSPGVVSSDVINQIRQ